VAKDVAVSGGPKYYGLISGSGNKGALVSPQNPLFGALGSKNPLLLPNAMSSPYAQRLYGATNKTTGTTAPKMTAQQAAAYNKKVSSNWMGTDRKLPPREQAQQDSGMSFLDALMAMAGGGGGGGYSGPSRAQIQAQAEPARARIEAMYKQYADMIAGREANIKNNYATAGQNLQGIYGGAAQTTNAAYDSARAAQIAQLKALGLTETAPPTNTDQQAYASSILSRLGAAGMSENEAARVAAINNNLALRNAATGEGARTLSSFDSSLMNALNSVGSGGGGGGGGGGLSPSNILAAMGMDYRAQQDAADMAFKQQQAGRMTPDKYQRYQAIIAANPDMDPALAVQLAG
jgi:hypothetical protein